MRITVNYCFIALLAAALLAGCAASPERRLAAAEREVARLAPPSQPLASFGDYRIAAMELDPEVARDDDKTAVAQELERRLRAELGPLLARRVGSRGPTLIVRPRVDRLRVVGGASRFFAGAFAGNSFIGMNLTLIDAASDTVIANPRIEQSASALGGAWSFGSTDRNLLDYIVATSYQYLADSP